MREPTDIVSGVLSSDDPYVRLWLRTLENAAEPGRLARGRLYYAAGNVVQLRVESGFLRGLVSGTTEAPYQVSTWVNEYSDSDWKAAQEAASKAAQEAASKAAQEAASKAAQGVASKAAQGWHQRRRRGGIKGGAGGRIKGGAGVASKAAGAQSCRGSILLRLNQPMRLKQPRSTSWRGWIVSGGH